ncbi:hypothetical protein [Flaviaesturariibacter terrae]
MSSLSTFRLLAGTIVLVLLLVSAGAGLLRRELSLSPRGEGARSGELIWESLSRQLPQASR